MAGRAARRRSRHAAANHDAADFDGTAGFDGTDRVVTVSIAFLGLPFGRTLSDSVGGAMHPGTFPNKT
jgi:hypothetical protein